MRDNERKAKYKVSEAALFMIHTDTQYLSERLESVKEKITTCSTCFHHFYADN